MARSHLVRFTGFLVLAGLLGAGCDKASHENIEKWRNTQQGPGKLKDTFKDGGAAPDLRAHAAQVLVALDEEEAIIEALPQLDAEAKSRVLDDLVTRLWDDAKVADPMQVPTDRQVRSKDMLFTLREHVGDDLRGRIDGYLLDWLAPNYERRAKLGRFEGEAIVRAIGPKAAPKVLAAAREILKRPAVGNRYEPLGDELLKSLASVSDPEAIGMLVTLGESPNANDETLQVRAMSAIGYAYKDSKVEPKVAASALKPHIDRLMKMATGTAGVPPANINFAYEAIGQAGPPECLTAAAELARNKAEAPRYAAVRIAIECAKAEGIVPVAEALPDSESYPQGIIDKYLTVPVMSRSSPEEIAAQARKLLEAKTWVARYIGVELLSKVGTKADAPRVAKLSADKTKLKGFWGDPKKDPEVKKKGPEPTLGARAQEVAKALEKRP